MSIPSYTMRVQNGEWNCLRCGEPLGGHAPTPFNQDIRIALPETCTTQDRCRDECVRIMVSMIEDVRQTRKVA